MTQQNKRKPDYEIKEGKMSLGIWREEGKEGKTYRTFSLQKVYMTEEGAKWTNSFTEADLKNAIELLQNAEKARIQTEYALGLFDFFRK